MCDGAAKYLRNSLTAVNAFNVFVLMGKAWDAQWQVLSEQAPYGERDALTDDNGSALSLSHSFERERTVVYTVDVGNGGWLDFV